MSAKVYLQYNRPEVQYFYVALVLCLTTCTSTYLPVNKGLKKANIITLLNSLPNCFRVPNSVCYSKSKELNIIKNYIFIIKD